MYTCTEHFYVPWGGPWCLVVFMMGLIGRKGRTRTGDRWVGTLVGCLHHEPSKPLWGCRPTSPFARCSIDQNVGRTMYLCGFLVFGFVDVCFVDVCSLFDCLMFLWFFDACYLLFNCCLVVLVFVIVDRVHMEMAAQQEVRCTRLDCMPKLAIQGILLLYLLQDVACHDVVQSIIYPLATN